MSQFEYKGRNSRGEIVTGKITAANSEIAADQLLYQSITPIHIEKLKDEGFSLKKILSSELIPQPVRLDDLIILCQQMYALLKANINVVGALKRLAESSRSKKLCETLNETSSDIASGFTISAAFRKHPKVFPLMMAGMLEAGENTGNLDETFLRISQYLEMESKTSKQAKEAMRYPMFVFSAITIAIIVINFMVVPSFTTLFEKFGGNLPLPTKILMKTSHLLTTQWHYLLLMFGSIIGLLIYALKSEAGEYFWHKWQLQIPIFGRLITQIWLARFSRTFAMMLKTDVPIIMALTLSSRTVQNRYLSAKIVDMRNRLERGEVFMQAALASELFTPLILQMLQVGDETASIDKMLEQAADFYEREVEYDLKHIVDMVEPILIGVLGAMILLLALGVFLPLWDMINLVKTK